MAPYLHTLFFVFFSFLFPFPFFFIFQIPRGFYLIREKPPPLIIDEQSACEMYDFRLGL